MVASRSSQSLARRLLPFAVFITAFTIVMMLLFMSMDIKGLRHQQAFNLSQDMDFLNVAQDNPQFISYIQAVHLRRPFDIRATSANISVYPAPPRTKFVAKLHNFMRGGVFVECNAYRHARPSDSEWLERELDWVGLLVQPDPADYVTLRRRARGRAHTIQACLSPTQYPKEVAFRQASVESAFNGSADHFTRVKCFPLYSILLAWNHPTVDYLSLDAEGAELQVLKTVPFHLVSVKVIGVKWQSEESRTKSLLRLMAARQYRLERILDPYLMFARSDLSV